MLKVYFDGVLIDDDSYTSLNNDYKLFTDSFKLGSVASNSFKLSVNKEMVFNYPTSVRIEDDNTTFYLVVDSITEEKYVYTYTLTDKLLNFNFNYDASEIINEKAELEEVCYLSDVWKDMCNKAGVEYDETYTFINDIEVSWYDNTIQARKYLSYIAELQGGYACILENGKQSFKPHKKASSKTIDIDECSDFILGEKKTITRVVYDTGAVFWAFGEDEGTTLYLDTTNVFITSEEVVENIYNSIVNFEFYLAEIPNAPMDSNIRAGDVVTFTDGVNNYPTIAQYSMSYGGRWVGGYSLKLNTEKQDETKLVGIKENVKKIESEIDRTNATLTVVAEQTSENSVNLTTMKLTVDGLVVKTEEIDELEERVTTVESSIGGLNVKLSETGGNNLLINANGLFDDNAATDAYGWTGPCKAYTDSEIQQKTLSKSVLFLQNGTRSQTVKYPNGSYTLSFKYKKLISLANCSVKINNTTVSLNETDWSNFELSFEITTGIITISFISDTNDACYICDNMLNYGAAKQTYSSNANEVYTDTVEIAKGITVKSNTANTISKNDADGFRILNKNTLETTNALTDKGIDTININADRGTIAGLNMMEINEQTWITRL